MFSPFILQYMIDSLPWFPVWLLIWLLVVVFVLIGLWIWQQIRKTGTPSPINGGKLKICIVLGSGGHTMELLHLATELGSQYAQRIYVLADSDKHSGNMLIG